MATAKKDNVEKFIGILRKAQKDGDLLLKDIPELHLRSRSTLERLINGFQHAYGIGRDAGHKPAEKRELTHIGGIAISPKAKAEPKADAKPDAPLVETDPTNEELKELEENVALAFEDFQKLSAKDLSEIYDNQTIRALAVKLGMPVTPTDPANVDAPFIAEVKIAVAAKAELIRQEREADDAAQKLKDEKEKAEQSKKEEKK